MKRMNLGCGSVQPKGWINVDGSLETRPVCMYLNVLATNFDDLALSVGGVDLDYIVCNHMLSDIGHHDLVPALKNIRSMLKEGGWLRILVPDIEKAIIAWEIGNEGWFPQDERTGGIHAKFCTFVTWFGESRSVFTWGYLFALLSEAGFWPISKALSCGHSMAAVDYWFDGITDLDDRCTEALIVEARR